MTVRRIWLSSRRIHATLPSRLSEAVSSYKNQPIILNTREPASTNELIDPLDRAFESHVRCFQSISKGLVYIEENLQVMYQSLLGSALYTEFESETSYFPAAAGKENQMSRSRTSATT